MNRIRLAEFVKVDSVKEKEAQLRCESALDATLDDLLGLVLIAEMPLETRARLLRGIGHVRGHIHAETRELQAEEGGRLNCRFV